MTYHVGFEFEATSSRGIPIPAISMTRVDVEPSSSIPLVYVGTLGTKNIIDAGSRLKIEGGRHDH